MKVTVSYRRPYSTVVESVILTGQAATDYALSQNRAKYLRSLETVSGFTVIITKEQYS